MRKFLAALTLITPIPIPGFMPEEKDLEGCKAFFPVVGLVLGIVGYLITVALQVVFPRLVTAIMLVVMLELFSKCFHLDGLADTADGFFSSRPREKKLEIMRDSRIGAMGVFAMLAVLGLKAAVFYCISPALLKYAVLLAPLAGRCAMPMYISITGYARSSGMAEVLYRRQSLLNFIWPLSFMLLAAWWLFSWHGIIGALAVAVWVIFWRSESFRQLGGGTGDTIGTCEEIAELLILLVLVAG
ncbi:adenosylcobinamide-GDP ribazoletransferase [Lentisphaerota bacterium ZTH]|nr:adenosylcobinamide-GDP ribazoletransferase [Lentisphaerota bacterium]WET07559.1 adenosylcobinamide-GDP ribazoletransferase [Lentisphaerota bacterium ZTH]